MGFKLLYCRRFIMIGPLVFQVCLDYTVTTEKELDTVEVLKAIQKAKDAKCRMNNSDKKVRDGWIMKPVQ